MRTSCLRDSGKVVNITSRMHLSENDIPAMWKILPKDQRDETNDRYKFGFLITFSNFSYRVCFFHTVAGAVRPMENAVADEL